MTLSDYFDSFVGPNQHKSMYDTASNQLEQLAKEHDANYELMDHDVADDILIAESQALSWPLNKLVETGMRTQKTLRRFGLDFSKRPGDKMGGYDDVFNRPPVGWMEQGNDARYMEGHGVPTPLPKPRPSVTIRNRPTTTPTPKTSTVAKGSTKMREPPKTKQAALALARRYAQNVAMGPVKNPPPPVDMNTTRTGKTKRKLRLPRKKTGIKIKRNGNVRERNTNVPVAVGRQFSTGMPKYTASKAGIMVQHEEYVADVASSSTGSWSPTVLTLNPGNNACFPWLSQIASNFEIFQFLKLEFHYRTYAPTSAQGNLLMVTDFDTLDSDYATESDVLQMSYVNESSLFLSCKHVVRLSKAAGGLMKTRYVTVSTLPSNADPRINNVGNFVYGISSATTTSASFGRLFVRYTIRLSQPTSNAINNFWIGNRFSAGTTATSVDWMACNNTVGIQGWGKPPGQITYSSSHGYGMSLPPGTWFVMFQACVASTSPSIAGNPFTVTLPTYSTSLSGVNVQLMNKVAVTNTATAQNYPVAQWGATQQEPYHNNCFGSFCPPSLATPSTYIGYVILRVDRSLGPSAVTTTPSFQVALSSACTPCNPGSYPSTEATPFIMVMPMSHFNWNLTNTNHGYTFGSTIDPLLQPHHQALQDKLLALEQKFLALKTCNLNNVNKRILSEDDDDYETSSVASRSSSRRK